jgi:hypothetical protein
VTLVGAALACGGRPGATSGAEGGHCYPNATCNSGLSCFSDRCVRYDGGVASGAGGAGGGLSDGGGGSGGTEVVDAAGSGGSSGASGGGAGTSGGGTAGTGGGGAAIATAGAGGSSSAGGGGAGGAAAGAGGSGNDAGAAGSGSVVNPCDRKTWTLVPRFLCDTVMCNFPQASQKDPAYAIDGDVTTRYTSGRPQGSEGPENVVLSFPRLVSITGARLFTNRAGDGPAAYLVEYSTDGAAFGPFTPPVAGPGSDDLTIALPSATSMRALRITQTGAKDVNWWSINELDVSDCLTR